MFLRGATPFFRKAHRSLTGRPLGQYAPDQGRTEAIFSGGHDISHRGTDFMALAFIYALVERLSMITVF